MCHNGSIKDWLKKINWREILTIVIVLTIGILGFGLGRMSKVEEIRVKEGSNKVAVAEEQKNNFVASKNGNKYYPPDCKSVARIKIENRIWFASRAEAEKAGYTLAAKC